jgi:hypothetical protein
MLFAAYSEWRLVDEPGLEDVRLAFLQSREPSLVCQKISRGGGRTFDFPLAESALCTNARVQHVQCQRAFALIQSAGT